MKQQTVAVWFRRGDGQEFEVMTGSEAYRVMANDSAFTRIPGPGANAEPEPASEEKPKGKGSKKTEVAE